ncbi:MAG: branched-chain amino acid transporter AzlD [Firmicutes bacterium CAG_194_44_15]|nr:MAG: branched-chain amino acid transporter AzlD [Firmicutes bacterium CAG_194_44_15]
MSQGHAAGIVAVAALVTMAIRFSPFVIFKKHTPAIVLYLGEVLPFAIMGMLVVYCLKGVTPLSGNHGIPELAAVLLTVGLHKWKHNTLLSILGGTICYMIFIQCIF